MSSSWSSLLCGLRGGTSPPASPHFGGRGGGGGDEDFCKESAMICTVLRIREVYPGSRILIFTHPGSRISDPGSKNSNKRGVKKICSHTFFCSHKLTKLNIILYLKC
jgi:hypothetical protein